MGFRYVFSNLIKPKYVKWYLWLLFLLCWMFEILFCLCMVFVMLNERIIKSKVLENDEYSKFIAHLMVSHAKWCKIYICPVWNLNWIVIWLVGLLNWNLNFPGWMLDDYGRGSDGSYKKITKIRHHTQRKHCVLLYSRAKRKRKIKSYDNFIQILFNWTERYLSFNLFGCCIIFFIIVSQIIFFFGICLDIHKSLLTIVRYSFSH